MTPPAAIRSILVVRLSAIGDIVLTTPVLRELREAFPGARIDFCTSEAFLPLLSGNPALRAVCIPGSLPATSYDLVVDLQNNRRSRSLVRSIDAGMVRRYRKRNWKKLLLVRFKLNIYGGTYRSVVDRYREALEGIVPSGGSTCALYPSMEDRAFAESVAGIGVPLLAVCFGATHFTKRYPEERFAAVIDNVIAEAGVQVLLLGGKDDAEREARILAALPAQVRSMVIPMAGRASLMQSAALLERADLVLCNDTGLMHMASSFGKRLLVLFGSSAREFGFLPWGAPYELFEVEGLPCRPCSHIGRPTCPKGHFACMAGITPERIASRIVELLNTAS